MHTRRGLKIFLFLCTIAVGRALLNTAQGNYTEQQVQNVTPSPCSSGPSSPNQPLTLDSVLQGLDGGNQSFLLQPGEHCVRNFSLVRDVAGLRFIGQDSVKINCLPGKGLAFYNVTSLSFINIAIDGCGMGPDQVNTFLSVVNSSIDFFFHIAETPDQYVAMAVGYCNNFLMEDSSVIGTKGLGLLGINLIGQPHLNNVTFAQNVPNGCFHTNNYTSSNEKVGGGALFAYHDYWNYENSNVTSLDISLNISDCHFIENSYCGYSSRNLTYLTYYKFEEVHDEDRRVDMGGGGGLSLLLTQLQYKVSVTVSNSNFRNNTALYGGGAYVAIFTGVFDSLVVFDGCQFVSNGVDKSVATDVTNYPITGSAITVFVDLVQPNFRLIDISMDTTPTDVRVVDSEFVNNTAYTGTVALYSLFNLVIPLHSGSEIELERCLFKENKAVIGTAIYAHEQKSTPFKLGVGITLCDVQIEYNTIFYTHRIQSPSDTSGVIHLVHLNMTLTGNSSVEHSVGSALKADASTVHFHKNVTFRNNSAAYGGGIHLEGSSVILVSDNATVGFYDNTGAVAGGAIYVSFASSTVTFSHGDCFLFFKISLDCLQFNGYDCGDITKFGMNIIFKGNQAYLGNMIYGSTLESCPWSTTFRNTYAPGTEFSERHLFEILYDELNFTSPFRFDRDPDDIMVVTTPVLNLSATDPESEELITELFVAPGIKHEIELSALDAFGRLVPSVVTSRASTANAISVLGSNYTFLNYNSTGSTTLMVTAGDSKPGSTVAVSLFTVDTFTMLGITVNFTDCPNGFYYNEKFSNCTCNEYLKNYSVSCTDDGRLLVPMNTWVGVDERNNLNLVTCSFDYCRPFVAVVSTEQESYFEQCNVGYNRTGIGCGSCAANFSSTLGSNRCQECTNSFLWLSILFATSGILLMLILLLLRISISGGFLNGILFFSNIASSYAPYYAPNFHSSFLLFSWLSLKVGYETCFYNGMKPLHVAALNFIFPLYLYLLLLVIVLLARWSSQFSRLLAKSHSSPTKLFATILVMTYSSLLESCIVALSFTKVTVFIENAPKQHLRWRHDPNQAYFHGFHGALATFSVVVLLFFLIPAPILWMFPAKILSIKILRKYKPVYDAVWAPLKPRYRFWVSLRLLFRVVPLFFASSHSSPNNLLLLALFLLVISFVHGMVQPFEGTAQNVFDGFLQLVLTFMTVVSLFFALHYEQVGVSLDVNCVDRINSDLRKLEKLKRTVIITLLSIAYVSCALIFIWHMMHHFTKPRIWAVRAWNAVACKRFHMKERGRTLTEKSNKSEKSDRSNTVLIQAEEVSDSINYGSIDTGPLTERKKKKEVVTFSELRESLLDDSVGLVDLYTVVKS